MKSISNLDLRGHQIKQVLAENVAFADIPDATLNESRFIYDTTNKALLYSNGTKWINVSKSDIQFVSNGVISVDGTNITVFRIATSGDVTMNTSNEAVIGTNKVSNTKLAKMPAKTIKGNNTTATANADDLTVAEVLDMLGIDLTALNNKVSDVKVNGISVVTGGVANIDLDTELADFKTSLKIGEANGLATLDSTGKVPSTQLPSYVDDVIEVYATYTTSATGGLSNIQLYSDAAHQNEITPEAGKIYVNITEDEPPYQFRWAGTEYIAIITGGLIIGTVSGTAADGGIAQAHYGNSTIHITPEERTTWNAKQNTNVTLSAATDSGTNTLPTTSTTKSVTQWFQLVVNFLKSLLNKVNTHTHNGTDAPKVSYNDLTDKPTIPDEYELPVATSTTLGGVKSGTDITVDASGNVSVNDNSHKHNASTITGLATVATSGSYNDLTNKPDIPKTYKTSSLTGTTGTVAATTHGCGAKPQVQAYLAGELVMCDIKINADGDVTWTAGEAFVAGADFRLVIQG